MSAELVRRLRAAADGTAGIDAYEIVLVDDGSNDRTAELLRSCTLRRSAHRRRAPLAQLRPPTGGDGRARHRARRRGRADRCRPARSARADPGDGRTLASRLSTSSTRYAASATARAASRFGPRGSSIALSQRLTKVVDPGRHRRLPADVAARRRRAQAHARTPPLYPRARLLGRVPANALSSTIATRALPANRNIRFRRCCASRSTGSPRSATCRCDLRRISASSFPVSRSLLRSVEILIRIFTGYNLPGYTSTMFAILFLGGVQLIGIGILGEYVGRIYEEIKGRPLYLIAETVRAESPPLGARTQNGTFAPNVTVQSAIA